MSTALPGESTTPLNERERQLLNRLLSDPASYPAAFKSWLIPFLEISDMDLPIESIHGLESRLATIGSGGGGGGGHTILDEGVILPAQPQLDFVGAGVTATDNAASSKTTVTIPGGGAGADANYVHTQGSPSATWVVTHNLNKYVAVDVVDSGSSVVLPDIHYDSLNGITLTFGSPTSGRAFVN